ncbi:hypothetical protein F0U44_17540 [Nocardioides humilatus]|uniref:SnoaL-like domain-containing protein n=1 Tax=Nocardioides humilatus TaxID=2607660 RepID=A0A5B1L9M2_9ACTN|nr:hypothetical protein [Nocardioides humilatus]KAA1416984.1 hypothetical protein F0U44_17540 [Nocardioides humilatus]
MLRVMVGLAVVVAILATVTTTLARHAAGPDDPDEVVVSARATDPLAVLHAWDRERSAAWARGDVAALRGLYLRGARAGERDVAMLRDWKNRGFRVRRMSMQVVAYDVRVRTPGRLVVLVTDRLADAVAVPVSGGPARSLPSDGLTTRRVAFRRTAGGWVVASVYARPLASTAATSGSAN